MILKRKTKLSLYRFGIACNILLLGVFVAYGIFISKGIDQYQKIIEMLNVLYVPLALISIVLLLYNFRLSFRINPVFLAILLPFHLFANPIVSIVFIKNGMLLQGKQLRRKKRIRSGNKISIGKIKYYAYILCTCLCLGFYLAIIMCFVTAIWFDGNYTELFFGSIRFFYIGLAISTLWNMIIALDSEKSTSSFVFLLIFGLFYNPFYCFKVLRNKWIRLPACPPPLPEEN